MEAEVAAEQLKVSESQDVEKIEIVDSVVDVPDENAGPKESCRERLAAAAHSVAASVYLSHFLSSWGDRMWSFSVGVYLADLSPKNLRLVASYGLTMGVVAVLMGAIIGDIVDKYPRLRVARTVLACQNVLVAVCAVLVCLVYYYQTIIYSEAWSSGLCEAGIIVISVAANLFSTAQKISVGKDWLSVICERDSARLAKLSSTMRAIDQFTLIVTPVLTGLLMTYGSMVISAICIAGWNVVSVFAEYALLLRIYKRVPALGATAREPSDPATKSLVDDTDKDVEQKNVETTLSSECESPALELVDKSEDVNSVAADDAAPAGEVVPNSRCSLLCQRFFSVFLTLKAGWSTYFSYDVKFAGFGLAFVFMTVLGFDNITVAYSYNQGASQAILGGVMSASAVTGIAATFAYPRIRKRIGIERTGLIGFWAEIIALSLCVVSIWSPGSPFDLSVLVNPDAATSTMTSPLAYLHSNASIRLPQYMYNSTTTSELSESATTQLSLDKNGNNYTSLILLLAGIVAARFGLWTLDLAISQLLLERVNPDQRGVVNGVQNSLNQIMDMLKFILAIAIPSQRHFGILILASYLAVCAGGISYAFYSYKIRGHLFHFDKVLCCQAAKKDYRLPSPETRAL